MPPASTSATVPTSPAHRRSSGFHMNACVPSIVCPWPAAAAAAAATNTSTAGGSGGGSHADA